MSSTDLRQFQDCFASAIAAVRIVSTGSFSWFRQRSTPLPAGIGEHLPQPALRQWLHSQIQFRLYQDFYCRGRAARTLPARSGPRPSSTDISRQAAAANAGSGFWSSGWNVIETTATGAVLEKENLRVFAPASQFTPKEIRAGDIASLRHPPGLEAASPGFYMALGNSEVSLKPGDCLVRTYWRIAPPASHRFVAAATTRLNSAGLPFRLKVLTEASADYRRDTAVLYLPRSLWEAARPVLASVHDSLRELLSTGAPALTLPIAHGVSLAEDPGGESFGMHRCGLIATAVLLAHDRGSNSLSARLEVLEEVFEESGISIERPHLNPGPAHEYQPLSQPPRAVRQSGLSAPAQFEPVQVALLAGRKIAAEALWSNGCCNWIGSSPSEFAFVPLGPDLYNGTAGIALFLAELHALTGEEEFRRLAEGGLAQCVRTADSIPPEARHGLFSGWTGIAVALARSAGLLARPALAGSAAALIRSLPEQAPLHDVIAGKAGAILALLYLERLVPLPEARALAVRLGEELLEAADSSSHGLSWPSPGNSHVRNLTGMSHGASGISLALLELFQCTADARFRIAALEAIRYEQEFYDPGVCNWPDFRRDARYPRRRRAFQTAWCHGAPGIGLNRLRAWQIVRDPALLSQALDAIETTAASLTAAMDAGAGSFCLCHGLAGNAELLRAALALLPDPPPRLQSVIAEVANRGALFHANSSLDFPSGAPASTPSLMLGLAGIGRFYLAFSTPLPSLLALSPDTPNS